MVIHMTKAYNKKEGTVYNNKAVKEAYEHLREYIDNLETQREIDRITEIKDCATKLGRQPPTRKKEEAGITEDIAKLGTRLQHMKKA